MDLINTLNHASNSDNNDMHKEIKGGHGGDPHTNATFPYPELVGGVPVEYDFVPSLLIACGFFVAFVIHIVKMSNKNRRTIASFASGTLALERMLALSMRMAASFRQDVRESWGLTEYQQITFAMGFVTLLHEQMYYLLYAVTLATREGVRFDEWIVMAKKDSGVMERREKERTWVRKRTVLYDWFVGLIQSLEGTMFSLRWPNSEGGGMTFLHLARLLSTLLAILLAAGLMASIHQIKAVDGVNLRIVKRIKLTIGIVAIVPIFRACDSFRTAYTLSTAPADSKPAKIAFYLFQLLPELAACLICVCTNYRGELDTGVWGDWPRGRIEAGKPEKSKTMKVLEFFFCPWKWPGLLAKGVLYLFRFIKGRVKRWNEQEREYENERQYGYGMDGGRFGRSREDRERLLGTPTASGWQSSIDLTSTNSEFSPEYDQGRHVKQETRPMRPPPLPLNSRTATPLTSSNLRSSVNPFKSPTTSKQPNSSASSIFETNQSNPPSTSTPPKSPSTLSRLGGSVSSWLFEDKTMDDNESSYSMKPLSRRRQRSALVTDVNLWTPRTPQSFSFNKGSESNV